MPFRPDAPDPTSPPRAPVSPGASASETERLAPILPLDAARRRRSPSLALHGAAPGPADRDALQREVLAAAVASGRLGTADLFAMVRLGILTDDIAMLPCDDRHRTENALDWERSYLEARGQVPADQPTASQVGCPIMAQAASAGAPACIEALRHRTQIPVWRPRDGFSRQSLDEGDPVVRSELRPCLLLSRELFRHLLLPLWEKGSR